MHREHKNEAHTHSAERRTGDRRRLRLVLGLVTAYMIAEGLGGLEQRSGLLVHTGLASGCAMAKYGRRGPKLIGARDRVVTGERWLLDGEKLAKHSISGGTSAWATYTRLRYGRMRLSKRVSPPMSTATASAILLYEDLFLVMVGAGAGGPSKRGRQPRSGAASVPQCSFGDRAGG
jgi:hypothetical protein